MFVCFSNFYFRYNFMEIREGDFLIRKVCKKKVRLLGPSVPVWEK